jgi:hypothetical protein
MNCIGDKGLCVVTRTCTDFQELRVFPSVSFGNQAFGVLGFIMKRGFHLNVYNFNLLLKGFCQRGDSDKAYGFVLYDEEELFGS